MIVRLMEIMVKAGGSVSLLRLQAESDGNAELSGNRLIATGCRFESGAPHRPLGRPIQGGEAAGLTDFQIVDAAVHVYEDQDAYRPFLTAKTGSQRIYGLRIDGL